MNSKLRIFLCEDEDNLGNILVELLEKEGYQVDRFADGEIASRSFVAGAYDLCLLDVMMPSKDGFTLAKEIRLLSPAIPIIFLTALGQRENIHEGLRLGADDYMTKPFSMEELTLRIEAVLRRSGRVEVKDLHELPEIFQIGRYVFNQTTQMLSAKLTLEEVEDVKRHYEGQKEPNVLSKLIPLPQEQMTFVYKQRLTTKEFELLILLCRFINKTLERAYALEKIWKRDASAGDDLPTQRNMDVYVNKLRRMLELDPAISIKNIHGKGYSLIVPDENGYVD